MAEETTAQPRRRWRTVAQMAEEYQGSYTEPAFRGLIDRAKPHYNAKGEWVEGNGLRYRFLSQAVRTARC